MKLKRKEIIESCKAQIALLNRNIAEAEKERKAAKKLGDAGAESAGYHWGRISGMVDGVTSLNIILEHLETK